MNDWGYAETVRRLLGRKVRALRAARGMSLAEVAHDAVLNTSALALLEAGRIDPGVSGLIGLAAALRCDPSELLPSADELTAELRTAELVAARGGCR